MPAKMNSDLNDSLYMKRCLQLAANGKETCSPNPMVGAVIVYENRIIGEGWHRKAGYPHAEPNAILSVKDRSLLKKATLYVNLEPCSHYGKTPPCVELIIREQIPRVVIGSLDPFPLVAGRGVKFLQGAGLEVVLGVEEEACRNLNRTFFHFQTEKRPWVILKWARTADGLIDWNRTPEQNKPSLKISTPLTQMLNHKLRSECDAILVGTKTAMMDNPSLNVRQWTGKNPLRLVIDRQGILPETANLLDGKLETIIYTSGEPHRIGKTIWKQIDFEENLLNNVLDDLYHLGIQTLLVEGGARLHESFLKADLWDEIHVETSVQTLGDGIPAPLISQILPPTSEVQSYGTGQNSREIRIHRHSLRLIK
jgi:diaminohydroxyphosphoribosylaminopyrimidine deaminase / 5-amino-6-(5-phosphoribosylamino)uracil reductase